MNVGLSLRLFQLPFDPQQRKDPYEWPLLSLAIDRHPTGVSGIGWMQRMARLNIDETYDLSHGTWDDEKLAVSQCGDKAWLLLMLLAVNCMSGPWSSDLRYQECCETLQRVWETMRPSEIPLLTAVVGDIADELQLPRTEPDLEKKCWHAVVTDGPLKAKGYICNLNRFHGFTDCGLHDIPRWHQRSLVLQLVNLEKKNFFTNIASTQFHLRAAASSHETGGVNSTTTSSKRESEADRGVRVGAGNAFRVAGLLYSDITNLWKWRILVEVGQPNKKWQGESNKLLRSTKETAKWVRAQQYGAFMKAVCDIGLSFARPRTLNSVGFLLPGALDVVARDGDVFFQNDLAKHMVKYCMHLAANRFKRELWLLRGWPSTSAQWCSGSTKGGEAVETLKKDFDNFQRLLAEKEARGSDALAQMCERSLFHVPSVQQLVAICQKEGWVWNQRMEKWADSRWSKILQSQLAEDGFNCAKQGARCQLTRTGREHLAYRDLIEGKTISQQHKFFDIQHGTSALPHGDSCLPRQAFRPVYKSLSVETGGPLGLVSFSQKTKWWSTSVPRLMQPVADLVASELLKSENAWDSAQHMWLSCFMAVEHSIMVKRTSARGGVVEDIWFLPLDVIDGSLALFWPLRAAGLTQDGCTLLEPAPGIASLTMLPVYDLNQWVARPIEWLSPIGQCDAKAMPDVREKPWSIRAKTTGDGDTLLRVGARHAFWSFSVPLLRKLRDHAMADVEPAGGDLFDLMWAMLARCLPEAEESQILDIMSLRLQDDTHAGTTVYDELILAEEGPVGLTPQEAQDLHEERSKLVTARSAAGTFARRYSGKYNEIRPAIMADPEPAPKKDDEGKRRQRHCQSDDCGLGSCCSQT